MLYLAKILHFNNLKFKFVKIFKKIFTTLSRQFNKFFSIHTSMNIFICAV